MFKKIEILDSLFDEYVKEVGIENITDEDIADALQRMRERGEEIPKGSLEQFYTEEGRYFVYIEI